MLGWDLATCLFINAYIFGLPNIKTGPDANPLAGARPNAVGSFFWPQLKEISAGNRRTI